MIQWVWAQMELFFKRHIMGHEPRWICRKCGGKAYLVITGSNTVEARCLHCRHITEFQSEGL